MERLGGGRVDLQLATFLLERLFLDTQLRLLASPLPFEFGRLFPELLGLVLQVPFELFQALLALVQLFRLVRQRVSRRTRDFQLCLALVERGLPPLQLGFPTGKFLLLFSLPQADRSLLVVVQCRARVERGFPACQVALPHVQMLSQFGRLLLQVVGRVALAACRPRPAAPCETVPPP